MDIGPYIVIGISVIVLLLVALAAALPKLRRYRVIVKRVGEKKKKKQVKPKRKGVWVRIA